MPRPLSPSDDAYFEPVSLGYACDVKYQVSRNLYFRSHPDHSETDFRNMLFRWRRQPTYFTRHIFDWAITPHMAVVSYLENDFQGVFERADLHVGDDGNVRHRALKTIHPHDFTKTGGRVSESTLDAEYPAVKSKFDHLAERFRRHLLTPGPYLYIMGEIRPFHEVKRLIEVLKARSSDHRFELLLVDKEGAVNQVLHGLDREVAKGWLPAAPPEKTPDRLWEGDDVAWSRILDRFAIGLPGLEAESFPHRVIAATAHARAADTPDETAWRVLIDASGDLLAAGFDYVGDRGAIRFDGQIQRFDGAGPDDHVFTHFLPSQTDTGGWARLSLEWSEGPRAVAILQDEGCRTPERAGVEAEGGRETQIFRVEPGVDHLRVVLLPQSGEGVFPAVRLEAQPAR